MFAYCGNNPVAFLDPSGYIFRSTEELYNARGGYYGSTGSNSSNSSFGIVPFIPIGFFEGIADTVTAAGSWLANKADELWDSLSKSFARAGSSIYRSNREVHHLVAKAAPNASQAAAILNLVLPNGVEESANKISIKTGLHRRLHTKLYYQITNNIIISAYNSANGDARLQAQNVYAALDQIRTIVVALDNLAPY